MHLLTIVRDSLIFLEPGVDSSEQPDSIVDRAHPRQAGHAVFNCFPGLAFTFRSHDAPGSCGVS